MSLKSPKVKVSRIPTVWLRWSSVLGSIPFLLYTADFFWLFESDIHRERFHDDMGSALQIWLGRHWIERIRASVMLPRGWSPTVYKLTECRQNGSAMIRVGTRIQSVLLSLVS